MDDRDLNQLLREWKAPDAPPHLRPPAARASTGRRWLAWLLTGSIRVPVPVGVAAALLAALWLFSGTRVGNPAAPPSSTPEPVVSLADFQPVEDVELRLWER